jgi:ribosome maturation factor RimP
VSATETQLDAVRAAIEPAVAALGLDLYDVELLGARDARTLRVTVTRGGGVDLDAITAVTQAVSPIVDRDDVISGPYALEVSSPGIERTLRRREHYEGARGEHISVKFHTEAGPRRIRGVLVDLDDDSIVVADETDERERVPLHDVTQARTVFEWGPQPRPGKPGKPRARVKEKR